jgi:hypothetical protein
MGSKRFHAHAKTCGVVGMTLADAESLRNSWLEAYPEMTEYFQLEKDQLDGSFVAETVGTGLRRSKCSYSSAANFPFQSLAAAGAKRALWALHKFNIPVVNFIH